MLNRLDIPHANYKIRLVLHDGPDKLRYVFTAILIVPIRIDNNISSQPERLLYPALKARASP